MKLKDQIAIITGAGRGIGRSIAIAFAKEGANIVICDINEEDANSVLKEVKGHSVDGIIIKADISRGDEVKRLIDATVNKFKEINVLVNNAGIIHPSPLEETSEEIWDKVVNVNLKGVFLCSTMAGKVMIRQKKGNIISIASGAGHAPDPQGSAYSVTKSGVKMLMKQIAVEWGKYNIRANSISPGFIRTPLTERNYRDPEMLRRRIEIVPIKKIGSPEDIANLAVFLASDESSYITGEDIAVDGGFLQTVFQQLPKRASR